MVTTNKLATFYLQCRPRTAPPRERKTTTTTTKEGVLQSIYGKLQKYSKILTIPWSPRSSSFVWGLLNYFTPSPLSPRTRQWLLSEHSIANWPKQSDWMRKTHRQFTFIEHSIGPKWPWSQELQSWLAALRRKKLFFRDPCPQPRRWNMNLLGYKYSRVATKFGDHSNPGSYL